MPIAMRAPAPTPANASVVRPVAVLTFAAPPAGKMSAMPDVSAGALGCAAGFGSSISDMALTCANAAEAPQRRAASAAAKRRLGLAMEIPRKVQGPIYYIG